MKDLIKHLELHNLWLLKNKFGERFGGENANLRGADLCAADISGAYLKGADLRGANLHDANLGGAFMKNASLGKAYLGGANLRVANLSGADLSGAVLRAANLSNADLGYANLSGADLSGADLGGADISNADLSGADLSNANLRNAVLGSTNLSGADLSGVNLRGAYLRGANLCGTDIRGTNFCGAYLRYAQLSDVKSDSSTAFFGVQCPEEGSFVAWKRCGDYIVKLEITEDAKRSSATSRACRCSEALVLEIQNQDGSPSDVTAVASDRDPSFVYRVGEIARVDGFSEDRWTPDASGIYFYITRCEAVEYKY